LKNSYEAAAKADALVLMTEWNQYRALDLERNRSSMKTPIFIDLRNVYDPVKMKEAGFQYFWVGRN
jgi:UDPglucose 6-dehydrogenase